MIAGLKRINEKIKLNNMNLCSSSKIIMQFSRPVLGTTMKKGRLYVATYLSYHSFYSLLTISVLLSINLTLIQFCTDRLILLEASCFLLPIRF